MFQNNETNGPENPLFADYLNKIKERSKKTRVYSPHQNTGLELAGILEDQAHKSLYIRLAKTNNPENLLRIAKGVAENKNINNKGAYFMKVLKESKKKANENRNDQK